MDRDLDALLAASQPPLAPSSPAVDAALIDVLRDAEELARTRPRRRRRRRRLAVAGGAVTIALAGAAAYAGGFLPAPQQGIVYGGERWSVGLDVQLPNGRICRAEYTVMPVQVSSLTPEHDAVEWHRMWTFAKSYLDHMDTASLLDERYVRKDRRLAKEAHDRMLRLFPPEEVGPMEKEKDFYIDAPGAEIMARLDRALTQASLPTDMLTSGVGSHCEERP